jgi:thioredoxin 1|tara:strand:- start:11643 stop:11981 length:339 start_codon:yes stop_codon:yes gene_type:complete
MGHFLRNKMKYIELTQENYKENTQSGVALVDFWAPWCGPCRMISPVIDQLAEEYEGKAKICKVNTEEQQELTMENQVRSVPTILFYKDGKIVDQLIGATSKAALEEKINKYL